ncbi:MAG: glycosyltransferase [Ignavibacterium sp.]|nr:MAG: glycosyltransferase [Ignavibacterium sp.]
MMIEYILWGVFLLLLIHYSIFLLSILRGLNNLKQSQDELSLNEFVSIIIPFRNESENIINNVQSLKKQNYPIERYEVIYVDDNSTDDSFPKLNGFKKPDNIRVLSLPKEYSPNAHKKRAIRYGIEQSKGEIIVTTDADCTYTENWLNSLVNNFDEETGFISGPVEFKDNSIVFSKLQKLEFAGLIITGAGLIGRGKPIICNAANIAYRKKVYDEVQGFEYDMDLSSGDDELLMQKIAQDTEYKVMFSLDRKSIVKTAPNNSISEFYHQRKRWASKGFFYKNKNLVIKLILIYLFYVGLIVQPLLIIFHPISFAVILILSILFKLFLEYLILKKGKSLLFTSLSLNWFVPSELLQVPYIVFAGFAGAFGNFHWKERKIKR